MRALHRSCAPSRRPRGWLGASAALALAVAVLATPAQAERAVATAAVAHLAGQPTGQSAGALGARLAQRLQDAYAAVNQALKARADRLASYQAALKRRERAAGRVETLKARQEGGVVLEQALREALVLDEEAQRSRASLLAAEAEVARLGARLLEVFDAVLAEKAQQVRALDASDPRRARALAGYRKLAEQRADVRQVLQPVLVQEGDAPSAAPVQSVRGRPDDDVETLLEKADLARDLEERFRRRAAAVRQRISEVEDERALARAAVDMSREESLWNERDYRPVFRGAAGSGPSAPGGGQGALSFLSGGAAVESAAPPPPSAVAADRADGTANEAPAFNSPPPAPSDSVDPSSGAGELVDDAERDTDDGLQTGVITPPSPQVAPTAPVHLPAEQVFLGTGAASDAQLRALIAGDDLTIEQLKALEKRLLHEARAMRGESQQLQRQLRGELKKRSHER